MTPLRIVFMGTPQFAVPSLKALIANPDLANVVAVFTQPDRPAGRGQKLHSPPVKECALAAGIECFQPVSINELEEKNRLAALMPDVVVVVAYAQFLSKGVLNIPRLGCINVHCSLLPKYRGAAPIQHALWQGETETGVTIIRLVSKLDAGPILSQEKTKIPEDATSETLFQELSELGGELLIKTLHAMREGSSQEQEQDESLATYAPAIEKQDGILNWAKTGSEILWQMRAHFPWPGSTVKTTHGAFKLLRARKSLQGPVENGSIVYGTMIVSSGSIWTKCADSWIEFLEIQPEGKKAMKVREYLNGLRNIEWTEVLK